MAVDAGARLMSPDATTALSHAEGVSDSTRARELYRYYQPSPQAESCLPLPQLASLGGAPPSSEPPSPSKRDPFTGAKYARKASSDTALTAFAQLVALKLGVDRSIISLVDGSNQYFIAESTKSVNLVSPDQHAAGDELWLGCGSAAKAGGFCENTISVKATATGQYPAFIIDDTTKDARFKDMPFVTGSPFVRFHAGVPLITKRGIPIGSLFVVDSKPRSGITDEQRDFMGTVAKTVMRHLEMVREVEEHRRGMKMSRGLASFVEGRSELAEAELDNGDGEGTTIAGNFETDHQMARTRSKTGSIRSSVAESISEVGVRDREYSAAMSQMGNTPSPPYEEQHATRPNISTASLPGSFLSTTHSHSTPATADLLEKSSGSDEAHSETSTIKVIFSRAANLIREAFEVNGGAVFYDAQKGFKIEPQTTTPLQPVDSGEEEQSTGDELRSPEELSLSSIDRRKDSDNSPDLGDGAYTRSTSESGRSVELLGFSTPQASSIHSEAYPGSHSFIPFNEHALHTLLRRYPRGKLWIFDTDGSVSSSSEDDNRRLKRQATQDQKDMQFRQRRQRRRARNMSDGKFLLRHFPGVRQLLFIPLWDAGRGRWLSGCCVWSTEPTRILTRQNELSFLSAFSNSVMAECYRLDTEVANQKKSDFIGSISHELRSPLHGILASAEFLLEEVQTGFSRGLVETVDSCGRTLLDTINHILDYSKINHFERNWKKNRKFSSRFQARDSSGALLLRQPDVPMINLFADVDLSIICEEVVEGIFAGHAYQAVTAPSFDMVTGPHRKMSDMKDHPSSATPRVTSDFNGNSQVSVIFACDYDNYEVTTQPGAVRRVIMNLLGNALKYTSHGYVKLSLEMTPIADLPSSGSNEVMGRSNVILTVSDTGKGMSPEFLRSKLFTPFVQENSLSMGVGLGLSIVKSIVTLLEGDISFDSELGRGTQVQVTLPMIRINLKHHDTASGTPRSITSMPREIDETITILRARVAGQAATLYGFDIETKDPIIYKMAQLLKASITRYVTQWYGMKIVPFGQKTKLIIANEGNSNTISQIVAKTAGYRPEPSIVVLCSHPSHYERCDSIKGSKASLSFVANPVGPLKLARAITQCLDGESSASAPSPPQVDSQQYSNDDLSNIFEEISAIPNHGEVLDNSRMAADSDNARKAIESPTPNAILEKAIEFPFDTLSDETPSSPQTALPSPTNSKRSSLVVPVKDSKLPSNSPSSTIKSAAELSLTTLLSITVPKPPPPKLRSPTLLLVDDNKINLSLLNTFMQKRKYELVHQAENGLEAVQRVQERPEGYDIIFMDISMPILDGFGATRQIRALEESRRRRAAEAAGLKSDSPRSPLTKGAIHNDSDHDAAEHDGETRSKEDEEVGEAEGALVIALTGLASSSDQSEAFSSGIDLFLTKPVAFREVGKLLDNWEANQGR